MARPSGSFESLVWCVVVALSGSDHLFSAAIALDKKERPILRPALALLRTLGSLNEAHMEEAIRRAKSSILVLAEFLSKFQGMNAYDCLRSLMGLLGEHGGEHGAWDVLDDLAGSRWCIHCHCTEKACDGIFEKLDLCTVVHVRDNLNSFSLQESEPMLCPKCQIQSVTISKCLHQPIPKCLLVLVANKGGTVKVSHSLEIQLNGEPERSLRYELKSLVWHTKTNWKSCFSTHGVFISSEGGTGTLRDPALLSTSHCEPVLAVYDKADDIVPSYSQRSLCDQGRQSPATPESNASRRKRKAKRQQGRRAEVETLSSFEKLLLKEEAEVEHVPSQRRKRNRAASSEPEIVDVLRGKDNAGGSLSLGRKHGVPYTHGHVERLMEPRGWLTSQILDLRLKQLQLRFPQNFYFNTSFFGLLCPGGFQSDTLDYDRVKGWTQRSKLPGQQASLFDCQQVFVPINEADRHWVMVVVDLRRSKPPIAFYDSLKESRDGTYYVRAIANYLRREWLDKIRKGASDMPTFRLRPYTPTYVPKQMNDSDCGVLLLHYAEVLSESASLRESSLSQSLSQERIQQIRHSLVEHIFFGED